MKKLLLLAMAAIVAFALLLAGCGNEKSASGDTKKGPIVIGQTMVADQIDPTVGGTPWALTSHGISETVYMLNEKGELVSRYVEGVKKLDSTTWEITLRKGVTFSDGSEIKADQFCDALNTVMEKNPLSNASAGKISFKKADDYRVLAVTERPVGNLKPILAEWTNVLFKKTDKGYIFSGPYVIKKFEPKVEVDLEPNRHYPEADKRGEVIIKAFKDAAALKLAFESGEVDLAFGLTPEMSQQLKAAGKIVKPIDAGYQYFGIVNLKSPLMENKKLREALDIGLNREDYIKALKGGHVATGLFAHYYPFAGDTKLVFNESEAKKKLDEAGYLLNSSGIREKDGKPLTIRILTYNSRPDLKIIMQVMVGQLKALGIDAKTQIVDSIDTEMEKGDFDIALYAQHTAPTGDPSYYLNQFFRTDGSKNKSHYSSPAVDALLNQMGEMPLGKDSYQLANTVQKQLHEDLPVLYLVDPEWNVGLSKRLKDYHIYSGDYYIVNAHLFVK